jgi:protocatechuate 3,4-dioxygenase beta subunit
MRTLPLAAVCLLSLVASSSALTAQERQQIIIGAGSDDGAMPFPGMGPRPLKTGTARIRGRVLSAETGSPLRRAQVRASGPEVGSRSTMTDGDGRFDFRDLPAGRISVSAVKSGYVSVQYGQTRPLESGKPIELADGQLLDKADILMPRGSVISGRVLDEFGDPVTDAMVTAMRSAWTDGRRRLRPAGRTAMSNDLGQFRLYGLAPGDYYVSATVRDMAVMEMSMAAMSGASSGASTPTSGYAPTYFPGTPNGADAQKITIAAGQDAQNTDFALLPVRLARITGTVISSDGKPVEGSMINAVPRGGDMAFGPMFGGGSARTNRSGAFTLTGVAPGDYVLQTRSLHITTSDAGDMMTFSARIGGPDGAESETGSLPLSVSGDDVSNVVIVTAKGATATGQVTFEGGAQPANLATLRILAAPTLLDGEMMGPGGSPATVKADGTFELRGLSGARMIRAAGLPPGWMLKAVHANGVDVTDTGIDLKPGEALAGMDVVLTSKMTELSGTVKGASGAAVKDYTLVVFSDDPQRWTLPNTRYVVGTRPDQEGRFRVRSLPAGSYYAAATDYIAQGEWGDPDVLDRLKREATKFTLAEGQTLTLDLQMP